MDSLNHSHIFKTPRASQINAENEAPEIRPEITGHSSIVAGLCLATSSFAPQPISDFDGNIASTFFHVPRHDFDFGGTFNDGSFLTHLDSGISSLTGHSLLSDSKTISSTFKTNKPTPFKRNEKEFETVIFLKCQDMTSYDLSLRDFTSSYQLPASTCLRKTPLQEFSIHLQQPHPFALKELLQECCEDLAKNSKASRDNDHLTGAAHFLGISFSLLSKGRRHLGAATCDRAFEVLHLLIKKPSLDHLMYFLMSQLLWPGTGVTGEIWRHLAAQAQITPGPLPLIHRVFNSFVQYIQSHGSEAYLDLIADCVVDILLRTYAASPSVSGCDVHEWTQDLALYTHFTKRVSARAYTVLNRYILASQENTPPSTLWHALSELYATADRCGWGHDDVLESASILREKSQTDESDLDSTYFQFHALVAVAASHRSRWDEFETGPQSSHEIAIQHLQKAKIVASSCPSLSPVARMETWFVLEEWFVEAEEWDHAAAERDECEMWLKGLKLRDLRAAGDLFL